MKGATHKIINGGRHRTVKGFKSHRTFTKTFTISLDEYGGSIKSAKKAITKIFNDNEENVKKKIKNLTIQKIDGTDSYKVDLTIKIWV